MKTNKFIAAFFLVLANLVMLGHAVVPHHHHDSALFCFGDDQRPGCSGHRDGNDPGNDRCTARAFFMVRTLPGDDDRHETGVCPGCGSHHFTDDDRPDGLTALCLPVRGLPEPVLWQETPLLLSFYRSPFHRDPALSPLGLRGPPFTV